MNARQRRRIARQVHQWAKGIPWAEIEAVVKGEGEYPKDGAPLRWAKGGWPVYEGHGYYSYLNDDCLMWGSFPLSHRVYYFWRKQREQPQRSPASDQPWAQDVKWMQLPMLERP